MNHPLHQPTPLSADHAQPRSGPIDTSGWHTHPFPWAHPTLLAPMEGVSHPTFRKLMAERGGIGMLCTEFVRITDQRINPRALAREVVKQPGMPLSVQVMGNSVQHMADAAGLMANLGADVVDINLGCPSPRVVKKGVGAAMLGDLGLLERVLSAMRAAVPGVLSAKIRAGIERADHFLAVGRVLQNAGVDFITVHPRRSADFYQNVADWRIIRALKDELDIPVVGNGDVWYAADAFRMRKETGCDAVMLGRPSLRNPWIFEQIADLAAGKTPREPAGDDLVALLHDVAEHYLAVYPAERLVIGKLKEWLTYTARAVSPELQLRHALRQATVTGLLAEVTTRIAGLPASEVDLNVHGHLGYERRGSAIL
ncbi:MAG: tRNA-dihydrouridine synthase family protein [Myxococcales bacterium]|nr:tRNA-dihydrouridine synthase family protein [Myxococcales bacterium]